MKKVKKKKLIFQQLKIKKVEKTVKKSFKKQFKNSYEIYRL